MVFISRWQPNIHHSQIIARAMRVIYVCNFGLQSLGKFQGCLRKRNGDRNHWGVYVSPTQAEYEQKK